MKGLSAVIKVLLSALLILAGSLPGRLPKDVGKYYTQQEIDSFTAAAKEACGSGLMIAMGGGFDRQKDFRPLVDRCVGHVNKAAPNFLFVPTAGMDEYDENEDKILWFKEAGCVTDVLLVSKASPEEVRRKVEWADIIYETGGNLKFLTENWKAKGMFEAVKAAFGRGAALIGPSSGAMCWAARGWDNCGEPELRITDRFPFIGREASYGFYDCSGVIPFCVCPHFDNIAWRSFVVEAVKLDIPSLCIENGAAVAFSNGGYEVISDARTPFRTAYLFIPGKGLRMLDLRTNAAFAAVADGELR